MLSCVRWLGSRKDAKKTFKDKNTVELFKFLIFPASKIDFHHFLPIFWAVLQLIEKKETRWGSFWLRPDVVDFEKVLADLQLNLLYQTSDYGIGRFPDVNDNLLIDFFCEIYLNPIQKSLEQPFDSTEWWHWELAVSSQRN